MAEPGKRTLKVGAVQMESRNGEVLKNLEHAEGFVEEAARRGAELLVLPEFMPTGYVFTKEIWDGAEPEEGPTVRWLRKQSEELGIWLGTSFLEADGEDFFNTFVLVDPSGRESGRVRKQTPAFAEAYFTKGDAGPHTINTKIGRIGIGICYENQLAFIPQMMYSQSVDLMLMPHSAPTPTRNPFIRGKYIKRYNEVLQNLASHYAEMLGVPAVFVNKSGPWKTPVPGLPLFPQDSSFPGLSAIADSDGEIKCQLGDEEGILVESVTLDPDRKTKTPPPTHGRWAMRLPLVAETWRIVEAAGSCSYSLSMERRRRALAVSGR